PKMFLLGGQRRLLTRFGVHEKARLRGLFQLSATVVVVLFVGGVLIAVTSTLTLAMRLLDPPAIPVLLILAGKALLRARAGPVRIVALVRTAAAAWCVAISVPFVRH
ncbi:MAG TPA: hypothetical protein VFY63_06595, partial [Pseudorhizobium sp.]|nr:hypothetical protein [Pseudorhizobium sp.]